MQPGNPPAKSPKAESEGGYSSTVGTSETHPESFADRSDGKSSASQQEELSAEAQESARLAEEEEAKATIKAFVADLRPEKSEANPAGGYTAETLPDLFNLLGMPVAMEDIRAALPQTERPILSDDEVMVAIEAIQQSQHVDTARILAAIEASIVKLNPFKYTLYKLGCMKDDEVVSKAALVQLDWDIQPKQRLFMSIAAVLVAVGTLMVVVIALLWVNSTYSHVTSQLRDIQRITKLSAIHLQESDFDALGTHLQGQTESIASLLSVRDNETENIVRSRAMDDVLMLATMINRSDVLHLFTPMAAALHGVKALVEATGAPAYTPAEVVEMLAGWDHIGNLSGFRRMVFKTPALPSTTLPLSTTAYTAASTDITLIYDSVTDPALTCLSDNTTATAVCDGGPLFYTGRFVSYDSTTNEAIYQASAPTGGARATTAPTTDDGYFNAFMNATYTLSSTSGTAATVRMSRSITADSDSIVGHDINADGTVPLLNGQTIAAAFIENATALYFTLYLPTVGVTILTLADREQLIVMREPEIVAMSAQLNSYETGATMVTRRGSLVSRVNPKTEQLTWITPLARLMSECYKTVPKTCADQDNLAFQSWKQRTALLDTVVAYTGSEMVVAVAPAAFDMQAVINIPVAVVLSEGREALSNIITRFKVLMPDAQSEMMLVVRDAKTGVLNPQVPDVFRYASECPNMKCKRGPTSSFAAELVMRTKTSGWVLQQDYRYEPVIAAYAYLQHLDTGVVVEQSAAAVQEKSLNVIINILDSQNSVSGASDETAIVHYDGTPTCQTFDRFANCDNAEFCYQHPTDPARYGVVYRSDCKNCRPLPIPIPFKVAYLTRPLCTLDGSAECSMRHDTVAALPLIEKNEAPRDAQGKDYRDRNVYAVYSYVPTFSVGIILKVDSSEVQKPIIKNVIIAVVIAALIIIIGLVALIVFSRTVLNRIEQEWLRYKVLIDTEKEKYASLIKTIVPPRIKRDLELLGRQSLTIPNVALSFVDVINFTESVRDWNVDVIAKFVTYYQYTVRALLKQYQIDRVRFVGDAVFSAAGLSAAETNKGRRNRRTNGRSGDGHTGTSSNTGGANGGPPQKMQNRSAGDDGGDTPKLGNNYHGGGGGSGSQHNSGVHNNNHRASNSLGNSQSTSGAVHHKRTNSVQSSESDGGLHGPEGAQPLSLEQRRMARRPPIYRQACYAAALIETFGPHYAHFPEDVPEVEEMFHHVTEEHGAVFPNVHTSKAGNPEEVGSVIMPAMRIGIHCGPATFSMLEIGNTPSFDMFGPSVALAKRMEATCTANRIHLTEQAKELLEQADHDMAFTFDAARKTAVKGIGTINSYFVASADITMPDELLKAMHVQHAVRRVYHEEFAYNNTDRNGGGGANNNNGGGGGANNNNGGNGNGGNNFIGINGVNNVTSNPNNNYGGGNNNNMRPQPAAYDAFDDGELDD